MKLRIKQSGLRKTRGSRVQPYTPMRPPPWAGQSSGGLDSRPALSLCTSRLCGPQFPHLQNRNNISYPTHFTRL